ncbi:MAG: RNA 2',3'-cyclic phosphodiesterase [Dehalococcoidia bacterium]
MSERPRLFVACELSAEIKQALAQMQAELRGCGLHRLRWVRPEGVHLTLKFLGETAAEKVPSIQEAVAAACRDSRSFAFSLGETGTFGDRRGPRVAWVGLSGEVEAIVELQERLESSLARQGFPREERPFSPHLTLARVPREIMGPEGPKILAAVEAVAVPTVAQRATEVSLMRSILGASGALYQRVAAWPLR